MFRRVFLTMTALSLLAFSMSHAKEKAAPEAKCPVSGKAVDMAKVVKHNGGDVYFCCGNCVKAFEANAEKFSAKANHQLAVTGQAKQTACPFTGGKLNKATAIKVSGTKVAFCCNNCKGKAEGMKDDALVTSVFGDKAFKKAYKVASKKDES